MVCGGFKQKWNEKPKVMDEQESRAKGSGNDRGSVAHKDAPRMLSGGAAWGLPKAWPGRRDKT